MQFDALSEVWLLWLVLPLSGPIPLRATRLWNILFVFCGTTAQAHRQSGAGSFEVEVHITLDVPALVDLSRGLRNNRDMYLCNLTQTFPFFATRVSVPNRTVDQQFHSLLA